MIEAGAILGLAAVLIGLCALLWHAAYGPARRRLRLAGRIILLSLIALPAVLFSAHRTSKSRTFQFFGEIVPRVDTDIPVVALTFDDGPFPGYAEEVLSILQREDVRATFFLNGWAIERYPGEAQQIIREGHEIGNHSYTHPQFLGKSLSFVREEVERTDRAIRRAGYSGPIHFRSPYGKKLLVLPFYLSRTGRKNIFWDIEPDSYGAVAESAEKITAHVLERAHPGSIILLHVMSDQRATSLEAVPRIITGLRERGYRFVTVSELLEIR